MGSSLSLVTILTIALPVSIPRGVHTYIHTYIRTPIWGILLDAGRGGGDHVASTRFLVLLTWKIPKVQRLSIRKYVSTR